MENVPIALRSVLNPAYLEHCLSAHYDTGTWRECVYWLQGLNDTYRLRTDSGLYILRVYRAAISVGDAAYELEILRQLATILGDGCTVVSEALARRTDGQLYTVLAAPEGKRVAALFRYVDGIENVLHDEASCYAFGKSAAELHAAMERVIEPESKAARFALDPGFLIDRPLERIIEYIGDKNASSTFLLEFGEELKRRIKSYAVQGLDWGLCHGDMHGNNHAFQLAGGFVHYDFEWTAPGWRAYDLAQVKIRKRQPAAGREELWQAVLSGYRSVRPFSARDEEAVDTFVWVRRLWVMSLDVAFIPSFSGALDYSDDWLNGFVEEIRGSGIL